MEHTMSLLRIIHRVALSALIILIATMPLITNISVVTILVILPALLIFIFSLSIVIEQKLNTLDVSKTIVNKKERCLIINCLHKKCWG